MNKLVIASKIAGGIAAAGVLYNMHHSGVRGAAENTKLKQANRIRDAYIPSRRLNDPSKLTSNLKDSWFRFNADLNFPDKINAFTGYVKHSFKQLATNIVPATLATGALLSKNYSKFFGLGLVLYGVKYFVCDVIDIGRPNYLK